MSNYYLEINHIWFTVFKRHICPVCNNALKKTIRLHEIASSSSNEKKYDFRSGDSYMLGNVRIYEVKFECIHCNVVYTVPEMMVFENKKT